MSKEGPMTAAELMAKLQADPDYQRRAAEKERVLQDREKADAEAFKPCLAELHSCGYKAATIEELVREYSPLADSVVGVLLSSLKGLSDPRQVESVVRALGASANSFDGRPLAQCFESTDDETLEWVIANTIALAHPHSIDDWLTELCKSPYWDKTLRELGLER